MTGGFTAVTTMIELNQGRPVNTVFRDNYVHDIHNHNWNILVSTPSVSPFASADHDNNTYFNITASTILLNHFEEGILTQTNFLIDSCESTQWLINCLYEEEYHLINSTIRNSRIVNTDSGAMIAAVAFTNKIRLQNVTIEDSSSGSSPMLSIRNSIKGVEIVDCTFEDIGK